jgi:phosphatidylserine/phosphatidylglycerophosphate/cardiolipin synthase-like enzyme
MIDSAREEVVLASFATHDEPTIVAALRRAADRGVGITLLLERPQDNPGYSSARDPFATLPARRLVWSRPARPERAAMHAKVIVVDRRSCLVGSANLTGAAMERNLECGVLIRGGDQPAQIRDHLFALLDAGTFTVTARAPAG